MNVKSSAILTCQAVHTEDEGNISAIYHSTWRNFPEDVCFVALQPNSGPERLIA